MTAPPALPEPPVLVAALYRFAALADPAVRRDPLYQLCDREGVRGTLLLAREGINGTIAGSSAAIAAVLAELRSWPGCDDLDVKFATAAAMPFHRLKVRLKREIVTMGVPDIDPLAGAGTYVEPQDWNALISAPGTVVIDTRNAYEVLAGRFAGAIDPQTTTFRDFPAWFQTVGQDLLARAGPRPKVAMYCTGGIRCEKSTAFLRQQGIDEVFHLKGGILNYLEQVPDDQSLWEGECFVFDERVTVGPGLSPGTHTLCRACRRPVSRAERALPQYEAGVSCPACYQERSDAQRATFRERARQQQRAEARGTTHVGARQPSHG